MTEYFFPFAFDTLKQGNPSAVQREPGEFYGNDAVNFLFSVFTKSDLYFRFITSTDVYHFLIFLFIYTQCHLLPLIYTVYLSDRFIRREETPPRQTLLWKPGEVPPRVSIWV